jgi:hypothetical protein
MKENLLDDGVGDTLVSAAFDDVTFISHGKGRNLRTRIKELEWRAQAHGKERPVHQAISYRMAQ